MFSMIGLLAQSTQQEVHAESIEDPYIHVERSTYLTSPAYRYNSQFINTYQVNVNEAGENMVGDAANEPSLAINPVDPDIMLIGWRQFSTIQSNFRQAGYAYTYNGGESWTFPEPIEAGIFRSDPVLDVDIDGNFYYNSLTLDDGDFVCDVFKADESFDWDEGTFAYGGDKQWMTIDKTGGSTTGNVYEIWNMVFSSCTPHDFTRSLNDGNSYHACTPLPYPVRWGTVAVGPEGQLYVCGDYGGDVIVAKSDNAGSSFLNMSWDYSTFVEMGGVKNSSGSPNPGGLLGQVWVVVDHSSSETRGNVYLLTTIENNETGDPSDIVFVKSTDEGYTWSSPVIINDDNEYYNYQWFPAISVAPNGRIDVSWYDTRDDFGVYQSKLYFSSSSDGGETWSPNVALSESFNPLIGYPNQNKIGDYTHMHSDETGAHLAWSATFNGEQDVYYSNILVEQLTSSKEVSQQQDVKVVPNPSDGIFEIELPEMVEECAVRVYNNLGQEVLRESYRNLDAFSLNLHSYSSNFYWVELKTEKGTYIKKLVKK